MEAELVTFGAIPKGLIFTALTCEYEDSSDCGHDDEVTHSGNGVHVSLCSTRKFLALVAPSCRAQFLVCGDDKESLVTYHNSFQGYLDVPRDSVSRLSATALAAIPMVFERNGTYLQASIAMVGFSDGFIRGYSKSGQTVFSQQLHLDAVTKLSFLYPSSLRENANQETFVALYSNVLCTIEGWSITRVIQNNVNKMNEGVGWNEHDEDTPYLAYRKWHLKEQALLVDVALLGHSTPSVYDYLCEASNVTGFDASIRSAPSPEAKVISVGEQPMIALYKITKDAGQIHMSEVMHAVASKMKSAVLGRISQAGEWFGWGSQQQQQPSTTRVDENKHRLSDLPMECSIPDNRRSVVSITVSPLGNLAALVDSFGRVLLLDCENFTIRRMWKGYRGAQCGWLLVREDFPDSKHKKKQTASFQGTKKTSQCLCIYAARRGILELWPTQCGRRVAAFHIGRGCRLLYSPCGWFTASTTLSSESGCIKANLRSERNSMMILTPLNSLLTVSVPLPYLLSKTSILAPFLTRFPLTYSLDDPVSLDVHLLKIFSQVIKSGEMKQVVQILSEMRSTKSLKQAIECLIKFHPNHCTSFTIDVVDVAIRRINPTNPNAHLLHRYLLGCRQLITLKVTLDNLQPRNLTADSKPIPFHEFLQQLLEIPKDLACYVTDMLEKYYRKFVPSKKVVKDLDLNGLIQSFILPSEVGDHLLADESYEKNPSNKIVTLLLRDEDESHLLDLGITLFMPILSKNQSANDIITIFEHSGIPKGILMTLFCQVFLIGRVVESNLTLLFQQLYDIFGALLRIKDIEDDQQSLWIDICRQCAITSNVGHAFSVVLIHQKLCYKSEEAVVSTEEMNEEWESLTPEKGHWATLYNNLEALVHLCNVVGAEALRKIPSVPFYDMPEDWDSSKGTFIVDTIMLQLKFFDKVYRNISMCAASLKNCGPCLITQCLCEWIVKMQYSPDVIRQMCMNNTNELESKYFSVISQINPLLKLLPCALSEKYLLLHCVWEAAYIRNDYHLSLYYISELHDQQTISGIVGLLWCLKFENIIVKSIESLKRGITLDQGAIELISVCRILFGYIFQFTLTKCDCNKSDEEDTKKDSVIYQTQNRINLMDITKGFPYLNTAVLHTCLELLLLFEISVQNQGSVINIISFFPNWLRNSLKKGLYKCAWQEQIPVQLQQKRLKFLLETVTVCFQSQPVMMSTPNCQAMARIPTDEICLDVMEFQDFIFLLGQLWKMDLDKIKNHWVCNLFAAGVIEQGKKIFLTIDDKTTILSDLLSLAGHLTDLLVHKMEGKAPRLALLAQTPPTLLNWMRKQSSSVAVKSCKKIEPSLMSVSQIITLLTPYISQTHSAKDRLAQLEKLTKFLLK